MVVATVAYVTGVIGVAKEPVVACGGMSDIDVQYRYTHSRWWAARRKI